MKPEPTELFKQALQLPPEGRAALAGVLLESLEGQVDADAEAAWESEIGRRLHQIDSGSVTLISWEEARRKISGS